MRRTALMFALAGMVGALLATPIAVYASHQFIDVADSHLFHNDIDWMRDNGITFGCGGGKYCPDDPVTRGEMAAFLRRLSEKKVVNAGELQGFTAAQLTPRAAFNSTGDAPNGADFTLSTTITAPAPGILLLSATIDAQNLTDFDLAGCLLEINDGFVSGTFMVSQLDGDTLTNTQEDCTTTGAAAVTAGTHTIDFEVLVGEPSTELFDASVWVLWVPLDGSGAIPTLATQLGQTSPSIDERPTD